MQACWIRRWSVSMIAVLTMIPLSAWISDGSYGQSEPATGDWSIFLPEDGGKELVVKSCFNCHDLARAVKLRGDREFWGDLISSMVANGAQFSSDEIAAMTKYLSAHLGPNQEPLVVPININTAKPPALRLLSPIAEQADQIVKAREQGTKFAAAEDLLKIDGITKEKLEKVKPFISAK